VVDRYGFDLEGRELLAGLTFKENYFKKLICYDWRRFKVGGMQRKKPEIDAEILWDVVEKNRCRGMQTEVLRC
jgi:hypothetical protein